MGLWKQWQEIGLGLEQRYRDLQTGLSDAEMAAIRADGGGLPEAVGLDPDPYVPDMTPGEAATIHRVGGMVGRVMDWARQ